MPQASPEQINDLTLPGARVKMEPRVIGAGETLRVNFSCKQNEAGGCAFSQGRLFSAFARKVFEASGNPDWFRRSGSSGLYNNAPCMELDGEGRYTADAAIIQNGQVPRSDNETKPHKRCTGNGSWYTDYTQVFNDAVEVIENPDGMTFKFRGGRPVQTEQPNQQISL